MGRALFIINTDYIFRLKSLYTSYNFTTDQETMVYFIIINISIFASVKINSWKILKASLCTFLAAIDYVNCINLKVMHVYLHSDSVHQ